MKYILQWNSKSWYEYFLNIFSSLCQTTHVQVTIGEIFIKLYIMHKFHSNFFCKFGWKEIE